MLNNFSNLIVVLCFIFTGCQTVDKGIQHLPIFVTEQFQSCRANEGVMRFSFESSGKNIDNVDVEWIAKNGLISAIKAYDPIGRTVLSGNYNSRLKVFYLNDKLGWIPPLISVDDDGLLIINGIDTAISYEDLGCFFDYKFPVVWLQSIESIDVGKNIKINVIDKMKRVSLVFKKLSADGGGLEMCADVRRRGWPFLFSPEYKLCFKVNREKKGILTWSDQFSIKWNNIIY